MTMGWKDLLFLIGRDFKFYCLQLEIEVEILKILVSFPLEMGVQGSFPIGIDVSG